MRESSHQDGELHVERPLTTTAEIVAADVYESQLARDVVLLRKVRKTSLSKKLSLAPQGQAREQVEEDERVKWCLVFAEWISEATD